MSKNLMTMVMVATMAMTTGMVACGGSGGDGAAPAAPEITIASPLATMIDGELMLDAAAVGLPYQVPLFANGAVAPCSWSTPDAALPDSLSLTSEGWIVGTPLVEGVKHFTVAVVDAAGVATSLRLCVNVVAGGASAFYLQCTQAAYVRRSQPSIVQTGELCVGGRVEEVGEVCHTFVRFDLPEIPAGVTARVDRFGIEVKYVEREGDLFATPADSTLSWTADSLTWSTQPGPGGCLTQPFHLELSELQTAILALDAAYIIPAERVCTFRIESSGPEVLFHADTRTHPRVDHLWLRLEYRGVLPASSGSKP